ncbi:MAG: BlaI/MecI/CopY family transcriptional regulator [Ilumatobacteraceae bacterium]
MGRRPDGALERDVMEVLWRATGSLTPAEVLERLDLDLAYTTVMTVLGRLHDKDHARRETRGRAFAYSAAVSESELAAQQMNSVLSSATDRVSALGGFVGVLTNGDRAALRRLLDGRGS